ncbi:hypothetical protein ES708_14305 [subsurface metagenome]
MKDKKTNLTDKELSLANAYVNCNYNATTAYENSTYSQNCTKTTVRVNAYKVLRKPHVLAYVQQLKTTVNERAAEIADLTRQEIIENARWLVQFGKEHQRPAAVASGNEQLGKIASVFSENVNQTDVVRQRQLDKKEQTTARKIADMCLRDSSDSREYSAEN